MFDDGHMYCFACKYYERVGYSTNCLDKTDDFLYLVGVEGEEAASVDPTNLPWKPQKTQDDTTVGHKDLRSDELAEDAHCGSSASHPRSSRKQDNEEANAYICFYRDRHKNKT